MSSLTFFSTCAIVLLAQSLTKEDARLVGFIFLAAAMVDLLIQIKG